MRALKLRVKSVATVIPGMSELPGSPCDNATAAPQATVAQLAPAAEPKPTDLIPKATALLRGVRGR